VTHQGLQHARPDRALGERAVSAPDQHVLPAIALEAKRVLRMRGQISLDRGRARRRSRRAARLR
jgi:hypothetical protein